MPTVLEAIAESNTLSQLLNRMDISKACLDIVANLIPLGLQTSISAGPITDKEWCILISNASAVAKLKQLMPTMLAAIQAKSINITSIRLKRSYN